MGNEQPAVEANDEFDAAFDAFAEGREPDVTEPEQKDDAAEHDAEPTAADAGTELNGEPTGESESKDDDPQAATSDEPENKGSDDKSSDDKNTDDKGDYWQHRYESDIGRVNAYQRKADDAAQQVATLQKEIATLKQQPPKQAADADGKAVKIDGIDMGELKEFSPDIHAALVQQSSLAQTAQAELNTLKNQLQESQQALSQQAADDHHAAILAAHSDVGELVNAPEFGDWMNTQPPAMRRIAEQGKTEDVIWMFDQFKATRAASEQKAKADVVQNKQKERIKIACPIVLL